MYGRMYLGLAEERVEKIRERVGIYIFEEGERRVT